VWNFCLWNVKIRSYVYVPRFFCEKFSLEEEEGLGMASFRARLPSYSDVYQKVSCSQGRGPSVAWDSGGPTRESELCNHLLTRCVALLGDFCLAWVVAVLKVGLNDSAGQISWALSFLFTNGLEKGYSPYRAVACDVDSWYTSLASRKHWTFIWKY